MVSSAGLIRNTAQLIDRLRKSPYIREWLFSPKMVSAACDNWVPLIKGATVCCKFP